MYRDITPVMASTEQRTGKTTSAPRVLAQAEEPLARQALSITGQQLFGAAP